MTNNSPMTDQEIVEALATKVMGWLALETEDGLAWIKELSGRLLLMHFADEWSPLTDWNHTMEVVERLTECWHQLELRIDQGGCLAEFNEGTKTSGRKGGKDPQRAICLAALQAISPTTDAK